jgi:uncharacterized protein (TIGR02171 family)
MFFLKLFSALFLEMILTLLLVSFSACGDDNSSSEEDLIPEENSPDDSTAVDSVGIDSLNIDSLGIDSLVSDSVVTEKEYEGFIYIRSKGKTTVLGTTSKKAKVDEQPAMKVVFGYDFYVGVHEVTQGEFGKLMNRSFKKDSSDYPQANVTFYDAVLYANALSKKNKMDTVYTYSSAQFAEDKSCENLVGLRTNYDVLGFRLPTEAEWMFVANTRSDDINGNLKEWVNDWKGLFADTTIENFVGAASANGMNEKILKGSSFVEKNVPLYARGDFYTVTPLSKAEYVSFRLALGKIENAVWFNPASGAVTSVITPLILAENVRSLFGTYQAKLVFRNDETGNLAYINYSNAANSVVEIRDDIDSYHPDISPDGKYVAFCTGLEGVAGESSVYVRELNESGSGLVKLNVEGAAIPRWRILDNGDTVIVFVTNPGTNKSESNWKKYSTWYVPFNNGKFGTPKKLLKGSFHGGLSFERGFAVTGASLLRVTRFTNKSQNNELWYNGEQACNVSLSMDGSNRTLFLDFAGNTGTTFVGKKYSVHEMLLIADSTGKLVQSIKSPKGYSFDHTEWVADKNLAVATLSNVNGAHQKIALVDVESDKIMELVDGAELWHPCIWVKSKKKVTQESSSSKSVKSSSSSSIAEKISSSEESSSSKLTGTSSEVSSSSEESSSSESAGSSSETSSSSENSSSSETPKSSSSSTSITTSSSVAVPLIIDPDSAGMYLNSTYGAIGNGLMRNNMELLWNYYDQTNVIVLGSSRPLDGIVPKQFNEKFFVLNLARTPSGIYESKFYLDHYVYPHVKNLRYIILSLDYDLWNWGPKSDHNFFYSDYKKFLGYVYDKNHEYWTAGIPEELAELTEDGYSDQNGEALRESMGYWSTGTCKGWGGNICNYDSTLLTSEKIEMAMDTLVDLVETAGKRNIYVIGIIFPMSPNYKKTGLFACYGARRSVADSLTKVLSGMHEKYPHFIVMDENKMGNHDYPNSMAEDQQHLCPAGAMQITHRVDSLLMTLENESP